MNYFLKISIPLLLNYIFSLNVFSQITVNEACNKNASVLKDEDGEFNDWLELYNNDSVEVDMGGYFLSDNSADLYKWKFPSVKIAPYSFLTIMASGKDRKASIDHWELIVKAPDIWKYVVPTTNIDSSWLFPGFNDSIWTSGKGGIGYGDGDDSTILVPPLYSVFIRRSFTVVDSAAISSAILVMDYDDAFIAYLNGIEIARSNVGINGKFTPFDELAFKEHEAQMYRGMDPEIFIIENKIIKTALKEGENILAFQVHNVSNNSSDLTAIPYLIVSINDKSNNYELLPPEIDLGKSLLHTNFKLSGNGETLFLTPPFSVTQSLYIPEMGIDNSYGRIPNGSDTLAYFEIPTPDSSNNISATYTGYASLPAFSMQAGFYTGAISLSLIPALTDVTIRYTTDGSEPTSSSKIYSAPLTIDSTKVIKAKSFASGLLPGKTVTNTYFINEKISIPVVSLSTNSELLFDWNTGIYMKGPSAEEGIPFFNANFWQDWEIPCNFEYFESSSTRAFDQLIGLEIQGNWSRSYPQKSFKVMARGNYGNSTLDYQFFKKKKLKKFRQIMLRNAGNDNNTLHIRDAFIHDLCYKTTHSDVQMYQPVVVFLNGSYWGVYNMREKINTRFISNDYGIDADSIDLLQYNGYLQDGSTENFEQFSQFVFENDFTDSANYAKMSSWLDIDNFMDYFVIETYSDNGDWLTNNVKFWRERKDGAKWRHILWDLDFYGTGWWSYTVNSLDTNLNKTDMASWKFSFQSYLCNKLVQNDKFRHSFINRYADLLNTLFNYSNVLKKIDEKLNIIDAEMPRHFLKWGEGFLDSTIGLPGGGSYDGWKEWNYDQFKTFIQNRPITARNHIQTTFQLKNQIPVTIKVYPPGAGRIQVNTVKIDSFPWAGIYFDSIPIQLTAIPNPGFEFAFWQSDIKIPNPFFNNSIYFNPDTGDIFTAYFYGAEPKGGITVSELNYKSSSSLNAGDWVELYNYGNIDRDISYWSFYDSDDFNQFKFPANTLLKQGEYLVLAQDTAKFRSKYSSVKNVIGSINFGLKSTGEALRIFNNEENQYLTLNYSNVAPWPLNADGTGKTIELLDPWQDVNSPYNWFAGCYGGSPGKAYVPCDTTGIKDQFSDFFGLTVYPNPFNDNLNFSFSLKTHSKVKIVLVDIAAKKSTVIENNLLSEGEHFYNFKTLDLKPGIYLCLLKTQTAEVVKMVIKTN